MPWREDGDADFGVSREGVLFLFIPAPLHLLEPHPHTGEMKVTMGELLVPVGLRSGLLPGLGRSVVGLWKLFIGSPSQCRAGLRRRRQRPGAGCEYE